MLRTDRTALGALPVTTPARTLLDVAGLVSPRVLERLLEQAEILRLVDRAELATWLDRRRGARAAKRLGAALAATAEPGVTRSDLEAALLELLHRHRIPRPLVNHRLGPYEVDFLWPEARLVVETDGRRHHGTAAAFERDRARDARLAVAGYQVMRFTYRQVTREPHRTAEAVRAVLERRRLPR